MVLDWVLLAVAGATLVYVYFTWTYGYWKKRGVPFEPPQFLFGSFKEVLLMRKTQGEVIEDIYKKTAGHDYVGFFQFRNPTLLIRDPELIKTVLVKEFNSFNKNSLLVNEDLDPLAARNPSFRDGEKWRKVRSLLTPVFTTGKIKLMFPLISSVCEEFKEYLEKEAPLSRPGGIETKEAATKFTTDVVALCAFGIHGNSLKDPEAELRKMGKKILAPSTSMAIRLLIITFFPALVKILRIRILSDELHSFFCKLVGDVVKYREDSGVVKNDFLQLLLTMKRRGRLEEEDEAVGLNPTPINSEYTDVDITAHALSFFADGFETSSVALSFALYELALNLGVQERLREEVFEMLKKHGGELTYDAVQEMTYLDMVLSESLRLHSPVTSHEKLCTKPYELPIPSGGTFTIEVGTSVVLPILALHKDPEHFPEPDKFDPERFSEERKASINRFTYLPFGHGPRQCLGMKFAQAQLKAGIAFVVANFEIRTTPKTPIPVVQDPTYFLAGAKGGLWLDFVKRN